MTMMRFRLLLPDQILVNTEIHQLSVEGLEGAFTLLPRHIDYVTVVVPGLLVYIDQDARENFLAVDSGTLVKKERDVRVSVRSAVRGENLQSLRETVSQQFEVLEDREREARAALASLETDLIRRFIDLGQY